MNDNRIIAAVLTVLVIAAAAGIYFLNAIFLPVVIALILAYLFEPLIALLEKRGVNRSLAIFLVFTGLVVIVVGMADFIVFALKQEFRDVQLNLPEYASRLYAGIPQKVKLFLDIETPEKAYLQVNNAFESLRGVSIDLFRETFLLVKRAFTSTLAFVLAIVGYFITPLYLYYFLKDLPKFKGALLDLIPERFRAGLMVRLSEIDELLSAFIRGQLLVCAILALLYSIGLYFIGIDLAIVIGATAGLTFIIPYFGTILGIVLSVVMALLKFHDILHPLLCLGWFGLVQVLEGAVITPRIVGDKVGLHPIITILAILIGGQLFGIFGMLLAVPVTAVLKVGFRSVLDYYRTTHYFTGE